MILIVGLGNPGKKYEETRHNVGFFVLDAFQKEERFPPFLKAKKFLAKMSRKGNIILAKPETFMNESGKSVGLLANFYKIKLRDVWVIHDDVDITLGEFKIQKGRSAAGHRGIESVINILGTKDFNRIRIGIRSEEGCKISTQKFVLEKFTLEEKKDIQKILPEIINGLQSIMVSARK